MITPAPAVRFAGRSLTLLLALLLAGCAIRPEPLTTEAISLRVAAVTEADPAPEITDMSLRGVLQYALHNNHDSQNQRFLSAVTRRDINFASNENLASVLVDAGYRVRDVRGWSNSETYDDGQRSPTYSSGEDQGIISDNLAFSWSALDFGLSYFRAKEAADTYLIQKETERRTVNALMLEIVSNWHLARSYSRLEGRVVGLTKRIHTAMEQARATGESQEQAPLDALNYERDLLDTLRAIEALELESHKAGITLAALLGVDQDMINVQYGKDNFDIEHPNLSLEELRVSAAVNRSEIRNQIYESRIEISQDQARTLALLPLPRLNISGDYNSNSFLLSNEWVTASINVVGNLTRLLQLPDAGRSRAEKLELANSKLHAMIYAVQLQVMIADHELSHASERYALATRYLEVTRSIRDQVASSVAADAATERDQIREDANAIIAELQFWKAHSEEEVAQLQRLISAGYDLVGPDGEIGLYLPVEAETATPSPGTARVADVAL